MYEQTSMNFDGLDECVSKWKAANDYFEESCAGKFKSSFGSFYLAENCINEIEKSIEAILDFTRSEQGYFDALIAALSPLADDEVKTHKKRKGGGGGNGSDESARGTDDVDPGKKTKVDPDVEQIELEGIAGELEALAKLNNLTLIQLLADDKYSDLIKRTLLNSQKVSDNMKQLIMNMDSTVARMFIAAMLKKGGYELFALNDLNVGILFNYLTSIAEKNGITVEQLLNDPQYSDLLKSAMSDCEEAAHLYDGWENLSGEEVQSNLLEVYNGDIPSELSSSNVGVTNEFVDTISGQSDIPYEELLTDPSYADVLKDATSEFARTAEFFGLVSNCSNSEVSMVANNYFSKM